MKKYLILKDYNNYIIIQNPSDSKDFILGSIIFMKNYHYSNNLWIKWKIDQQYIISPFLKDSYKIFKQYNTFDELLINIPELMLL